MLGSSTYKGERGDKDDPLACDWEADESKDDRDGVANDDEVRDGRTGRLEEDHRVEQVEACCAHGGYDNNKKINTTLTVTLCPPKDMKEREEHYSE